MRRIPRRKPAGLLETHTMQKDACRSDAALRGLLLPDFAHHRLVQARDQLLLLAQLAKPRGTEPEEFELRITPEALSELFDRMALSIDDVLGCVLEAPETSQPS
ncbi:hypothetical protein GCM10025759_24620 [Lysobacter panacisoli]|uniref:XAC0095-like domain-containing protein n=1 Tax=Lysobacter panacisoli TaxID=1255263 RepID=A0ABP9LJ22_9GAMM